jgi:hypothetical protein
MRKVTARLSAGWATLFLVLVAGPAYATTGPNYPPTPAPTTSVEGVSSGVAGSVTGSNMPHSGFDPSYLGWGIAVLLLGVVLVLIGRRRAH